MNYKNVDRGRFKYLLMTGITSPVLARFFKENRVALIQASAKAQNLPKGPDAQVDLLLKMPVKAFKIFEQWVFKTVVFPDTLDIEEVLKQYRASDFSENGLTGKTAQEFALSTIALLFQEECPTSLLDFLRTPISGTKIEHDVAPKVVEKITPVYKFDDIVLEAITSACVGELSGPILSKLPQDVSRFLTGLQEIRNGNAADAERSLFELEDSPQMHSALRAALNDDRVRHIKHFTERRGIHFTSAIDLSGIEELNVELEEAEIFGRCTHQVATLNGEVSYIEIMGILVGKSLVRLPEIALREFVPTEGRVIAFSPKPFGIRAPRKEECGVWRVEEFETEKSIRCRIKQMTRQVYEVYELPFSSAQYDSVRNALHQHDGASGNRALFLLTDGLIVGLRKEIKDYSKEQFDEPLDAWNYLTGYESKGKRFVIGLLPVPDMTYDCSEVEKLLRTLLRSNQQLASIPKLSRAQMQLLLEAFSQTGRSIDPARLTRLETEFSHLMNSAENISAIFNAIFDHPRIRAELENAKKAAVDDLLKSKSALQADIARLQAEKANIEKVIKNKQREEAKLPIQISRAIKTAFESAQDEGLKTLGNLAVFKSLIDITEGKSDKVLSLSGPNTEFRPTGKVIYEVDLDPMPIACADIFKSLGVVRGTASAIAVASRLALDSGLILIFSGITAAVAARKYACAVSEHKVRVSDIPLGLIDGCDVRRNMESLQEWDVLVLKNYNLSAVEAYGSDLINFVTERLAGLFDCNNKIIVTGSSSIAALPASNAMSKISLHIDLHRESYAEVENDVIGFRDRIEDEHRVIDISQRPWKIALRRILSMAETLTKEDQKIVLPIIYAGMVEYLRPSA